jgi:N-acetyltransferase
VILGTGEALAAEWHEPLQLHGFGLTLTPLVVEDAEDFLAALGPPEESADVVAHLSFAPPADLAGATEIIESAAHDHLRIAYAQRLDTTGELVGSTSFYEIDPTLRALAIGHTWVARRHWRTFVNTASKLIMLGRAFEGLGAERVVWHTDIRNTRSQQAIARLGAVREGCCATTGSAGTARGGTRCSSRCSPTSGPTSGEGWRSGSGPAPTDGIDPGCGRRRLPP